MEIKVQLVLQSGVSRGLREVLLSGYGRVYPSEIVSEFEPKTCETRMISTQVEAERVVHAGRAFQGRETDRDGRLRLLARVVHRCEQLGGIGR